MKSSRVLLFLFFILHFVACNNDTEITILKNDCLYRSYGPLLVGQNISFSYALAIPSSAGKLVAAQAKSSIPGGIATYFDPNSYYTNNSGQDVGVLVTEPLANDDYKTSVRFIVDTCAATLRYFYNIPEEARGQHVSFVFSGTASNGETVSYSMGPYQVSKMDMFLNVEIPNDSYLSFHGDDGISVYSKADLPNASKDIDLIYSYRTISSQIALRHSFLAPDLTALARYTPYFDDVTLPGNQSNTKLRIAPAQIRDQQLSSLQYGVFVDDPDFEALNMASDGNSLINVLREEGFWLETADKMYRAYVFVNAVTSNGGVTVSIKRYKI